MSCTGLIGGGRWAQVIASVLERIDSGPVQVASVGNPSAWENRPDGWRSVEMAAMLADPEVCRVIVARRARDHAKTVLSALRAGKDVLVEKPFCLTHAESDAIRAAAQGRVCQTGLVLLHARNQQRFRNACLAIGPVKQLRIVWADPRGETRGGAKKSHDLALNPVQDVLPHIWSLMRPMLVGPIVFRDAVLSDDGTGVTLRFDGTAQIECVIARDQACRERRMEVTGPNVNAYLNFASEPGNAELNGKSLDVATGYSSPLEAELRSFLFGPCDPLSDVAQAFEALDLTLSAMAHIRRLQMVVIRDGCESRNLAAVRALREIALGGITGCGQPASRQKAARWLEIEPSHAGFSALWTAAVLADKRQETCHADARP